jgi:uncharacterized FlaG/YvyC family protein
MNEEDISATGQFASAVSSDPVPAYKPPEVATRSPDAPSSGATPATAAGGSRSGAAAGSSQSTRPASDAEISTAIAAANANLASSNRVLEYRVDAATGISVTMIRNSLTGAVLQQMPGADIIALARMLADWAPGKHMLLDLIA